MTQENQPAPQTSPPQPAPDAQHGAPPAPPAPPAAPPASPADAGGEPRRERERGRGRGGRGGPRHRRDERAPDEGGIESSVVRIYRCAKVVKGGRTFSFG